MNETEPLRNLPIPSGAAETPFPGESALHRTIREDCRFFAGLAAGLGAFYALCFIKAGGCGINVPAYALGWCIASHLALRRLGCASLRRDGRWYAAVLALAGSVFWTANEFLQAVSIAGCLLLQGFWLLNVFADVRGWHFGKAAGAMARLFFRSVGRCFEPFLHLAALSRAGRGRGRYVLLGLLFALPLSALVLALLSSGDAAFRELIRRAFSHWDLEGLADALQWLGTFLLVSLLFYGSLCAQADRPEPEAQPEANKAPALVAVTFTAVLTAIYLLFCAVQLRMLFLTDGSGLPAGYTYAEYAREGFFQLLAVSAINVLLVIVAQRRFDKSRTLRTLLTVLSGCTYLLILSSGRRMALYVQVYLLTVPRLLVLWFLLVLAMVLTGALITVFRPGFRLFRYSLVVCLCAWLAFVFVRPDALAARYDLRRDGCSISTLSLIRYDLAADAVPELRPWLDTDRAAIETYMGGCPAGGFPQQYREAGLRGFNWSLWQANRLAEEYEDGT